MHPVGGSCSLWGGIVGSKKVRMFFGDNGVTVVCEFLYVRSYYCVRGKHLFCHSNVSSWPVLFCLSEVSIS